MACKCGSDRLLHVNAKCSDMCHTSFTRSTNDGFKDNERIGYVPGGIGIGGGDYLHLTICADCGTIQDWVKRSDEEILESLSE